MTSTTPPASSENRDALPGYEVALFCYRTGTTASIFEVTYSDGRRQLLGRHNWRLRPIDPARPALESVYDLILELGYQLSLTGGREAAPGAPGGGGGE